MPKLFDQLSMLRRAKVRTLEKSTHIRKRLPNFFVNGYHKTLIQRLVMEERLLFLVLVYSVPRIFTWIFNLTAHPGSGSRLTQCVMYRLFARPHTNLCGNPGVDRDRSSSAQRFTNVQYMSVL